MKKSVIITLCAALLALLFVVYPPAYSQFQNFGNLVLGNTGTVGYINVKDTRYAGGAKGDGQEVVDAVVAATSTVTSATANFTTNARVGQIVYGVSDSTGTAVLPQGTITTINSSTSITVSTTGTGAFTAVRLRWGSDDTAAIAAAVTATIAIGKRAVGLGTFYMPTGFYLCNKAVTTACIDFVTGGPYNSVTVLGDGPNSSVIWPTPNMTASANSVGNCLAITGTDFTVENWGCDGGNYSAATSQKVAVSFGLSTITGTTDSTPQLIENVAIRNWQKYSAANANCGLYSGAAKTILINVNVEGNNCGAKLQGGASAVIDSLFTNNNNGYNLQLSQGGDYPTGGAFVIRTTIDECGTYTPACLDIAGSVDVAISDSTIYASNSGVAIQVDGTSKATISNSRITPYNTDTNGTGLKILSGGIVTASNSKFRSSGTGVGINNAGTFTDGCGNFIEVNGGTGGITNTGSFKNCFNQPLGGTCLLASAAGPLACGSAGQGKVAIPISTASYTINTTAIEDNSTVEITPLTANNGIPSAPTCVAPTTTVPVVSAIVAKTSFTITQTSIASITCYAWRIATP